VARLNQPTRYQLTSFPRSVWDLVVFITTSAVVVDLVLFGIALSGLEGGGSGEFGMSWAMVKGFVLVLGLVALAVLVRSPGLGMAALFLALFFFEDWGLTDFRLSPWLSEHFDLIGLRAVIPAPVQAWMAFLMMSLLATVAGVVLRISGYGHSPFLRRVSRVLVVLVGLLLAFSGVWDLFADAYADPALRLVANAGTLITLSFAVGYLSGLLRIGVLWYES
jgi:hypothetical protein